MGMAAGRISKSPPANFALRGEHYTGNKLPTRAVMPLPIFACTAFIPQVNSLNKSAGCSTMFSKSTPGRNEPSSNFLPFFSSFSVFCLQQ